MLREAVKIDSLFELMEVIKSFTALVDTIGGWTVVVVYLVSVDSY